MSQSPMRTGLTFAASTSGDAPTAATSMPISLAARRRTAPASPVPGTKKVPAGHVLPSAWNPFLSQRTSCPALSSRLTARKLSLTRRSRTYPATTAFDSKTPGAGLKTSGITWNGPPKPSKILSKTMPIW